MFRISRADLVLTHDLSVPIQITRPSFSPPATQPTGPNVLMAAVASSRCRQQHTVCTQTHTQNTDMQSISGLH
jgi:hypothetical protein